MIDGASPEMIDHPASGEVPAPQHDDPSTEVSLPGAAEPQPSAPAKPERESRGARTRRMAHRGRLHLYALAAVALLVYVVALATTNTRDVRVDWVFAHSTVPLVWLTLFAAILGWLLGTLVTILFRRRTRAPHQP
jgi:uncharacterized integral membrane protein